MPAEHLARRVDVALIDDHPVVLEGIQSWISRDPLQRVRVVACGSDPDAVLAGPGGDADVLVLDLNLGGVLMLDRVADLSAAGRRIVVFTHDTDEHTILAVLDRGAYAYLAKHEGAAHFVETMAAAAADRPYVTPSVAGAMWADTRGSRPQLSERELDALLLWFQGMSKASVALRMGISVHTATQYIDRVRIKYAKAGRPSPTKAALLARAIEDGLITASEVGEYRSRAADPSVDP
ncbi:DNA-binding response regulator [Catellatospora methionotrophica]|uniref:DNA-binding response regulator n=1 Tax=Catellatospora methionotrophica TaxID=121620 RepID=A0A8J3L9R0_9ACTN|nr:response regulator transcription factor [Catellatospora methionotrophica]GIG15022.1 DNA-binding response regulator [Catellatospora methionotrophica]